MEYKRSELIRNLRVSSTKKIDNRGMSIINALHKTDGARVVYYPSGVIIKEHAEIMSQFKKPTNIRIDGFNHFLVFGETLSESIAYRFTTVGDKLYVGTYTRKEDAWVLEIGFRIERERGRVYATVFYSRAVFDGEATTKLVEGAIEAGSQVVESLNFILTVIPLSKNESSLSNNELPVYSLDFEAALNDPDEMEIVEEVDVPPIKTITSRKLDLMSKVILAPKMKMRKEHDPFVKLGLDISPSVLFVEIKSSKDMVKKSAHYNFEHLPFPDTMFLCSLEITPLDELKPVVTNDNLMIRIREKKDGNVYIMTYRDTPNGKLTYMSLMEVNVNTGEHRRILPTDESGYGKVIDEMNLVVLRTARQAMFTTLNYEKIVKTDPTRLFAVKKKVNKRDTPLYLEYTLDKTKAIKYTGVKRGGSHSSPIEHERIGHYRRYKSGKVVFVQGSIVNKGKGGRVNKDYIF